MIRNAKLLAAITIIICAIMFGAGLKPKGFRLHNDVRWLDTINGIGFGKTGIAYTVKKQSLESAVLPESISIEIVIKAEAQRRHRIATIFDLWNPSDRRHVALCQWDSSLMLMKSRSEYLRDTKSKLVKKISLRMPCVIVISSRRNKGTNLYVNGALRKSTRAFDICDSGATLGRLVFGNSPRANCPWRGEIHALTIHEIAFNESEVRQRYGQWTQTHRLAESGRILASYTFEERGGSVSRDRGWALGGLYIPSILIIPQKRVFARPWKNFTLNKSYVNDIMVNLFGFIPFGFFFATLLWHMGGFARRYRMVVCIFIGMGISVLFELVQSYMPTRCSQLSDVFLNVLGTLAGAIAAMKYSPGIKNPSGWSEITLSYEKK